MPPKIDPEVLALVADFSRRRPNSRGSKALGLMTRNGSVTTEELKALGYEQSPRIISDLKDNGIPIVTEADTSSTGKRMARYRLGTAQQIRVGQTGRTNFSKKFRAALFDYYGPKDAITGAEHEPRSLQIDHRIPYRVAGDAGLATNDISAFMLLDKKSNRAKSWSCENCKNFIELRDPSLCRSCFWAFPDNYHHVAMVDIRRAEIVWQGAEIRDYESLAQLAMDQNLTIAELLKALGRREVRD